MHARVSYPVDRNFSFSLQEFCIPFKDGKHNKYDESPADRISPFIPTLAVSVSLSTLTVSIRRLPVSKKDGNTSS